MSKAGRDFTIIPNKLLKLGLDAYELATFLALKSHANNSGNSMFPGWERLRELTGQSRDRLWKSLSTLRDLNVIQWDRGGTGRANTYHVLGEGCWTPKGHVDNSKFRGENLEIRGDKSPSRGENSGGGSPPDGLVKSATRTRGSPPDGLQPDPSEQDSLNQISFQELMTRIRERGANPPRGDPS